MAATFLKKAAKRGAKLIVMDSRGQNQGISRYASHILQFTPGRDVALINAMLHTIVTERMVDVQYIQARTEGRQVQMARPAVPLRGDARQEWELIQLIARRAGLGWKYGHVSEV